jgi:dUTP pyrophosphatase
MQLKFKKLNQNAIVPKQGSEHSAGLDLSVLLDTPSISLAPGETIVFNTGLAVEIPSGYFGAIYPRSSTGFKKNLHLLNTVGVIDSDYRGELKLGFRNFGPTAQEVENGERVAQLIIQPYLPTTIAEVDKLENTKRGEGGFGSTGKF